MCSGKILLTRDLTSPQHCAEPWSRCGVCRDTCPDPDSRLWVGTNAHRAVASQTQLGSGWFGSALELLFQTPVSRCRSRQFQNPPNSVEHIQQSINFKYPDTVLLLYTFCLAFVKLLGWLECLRLFSRSGRCFVQHRCSQCSPPQGCPGQSFCWKCSLSKNQRLLLQTCACPRGLSHPWKCSVRSREAHSLPGTDFPGGIVALRDSTWMLEVCRYRAQGCGVLRDVGIAYTVPPGDARPPLHAHWHLNWVGM